jgi:hypothetical protein
MCVRLHFARFLACLCIATGAAGPIHAQSGVGVEVEEVQDVRAGIGPYQGRLELRLNLTGTDLEKIDAARVVVKEGRDDKGNELWEGGEQADFQSRDSNMGQLSVSLRNPARASKSIRLSGSVELFVPSKDPNAVVKVDKALTKLDKPIVSKALKAEKISITILSPKKYEEKRGQNRLDDAKIAEIREEAKKEGVDEKEVEAMIELAKAFQELGGGSPSEASVILSGRKSDFDRILRVRLFAPDGTELSVPSRSTSSTGDDATMILDLSEPPPADTALEITLITKKATISVPYELPGIPLP